MEIVIKSSGGWFENGYDRRIVLDAGRIVALQLVFNSTSETNEPIRLLVDSSATTTLAQILDAQLQLNQNSTTTFNAVYYNLGYTIEVSLFQSFNESVNLNTYFFPDDWISTQRQRPKPP